MLAWPRLADWLADRLADGVPPARLLADTPVPLLWLVLPREPADPPPADPAERVAAVNRRRAARGLPPYAPTDFLPHLKPGAADAR